MNTKFAASAIGVLLWVGCLSAYGQQAAAPSQRMLPQCSGQVARLPGSIAGPCKPVSTGTQTQQLSNDLLSNNLSRDDSGAVYVEFAVPGSTCEAAFARCTTPVAINQSGAVTGYYADATAALHGFVRAASGAITTFDGPGATCSNGSTCTIPVGINQQGAITGFYCDANTCHGFLRDPGGTVTAFDPPGSVFTLFYTGGINAAGVVTGTYYDVNFRAHGFLRSPSGAFTSFDALNSVNGTVPTGINDAGEVVGSFYDANFASLGFVRAPDGTMVTVAPTGSIYTSPNAINLEGTITGSWQDANIVIHGFLRSSDGTLTTFDVPGAYQTEPSAIDPAGTITGYFEEAKGFHGFVRASDGTITTFDPPGSAEPESLTFANGINAAGVVTGWYIDPSFIGYGFLRMPTQ
jgi:uncharacterized membrane protein